MTPPGSTVLHCKQCGNPLESTASPLGCVFCLRLAVLSESENERRRFQHYEVCLRADGSLAELGRGAMGVTYEALDLNLGSTVALKIISAHSSADTRTRERFRREARAAAQLRHPNVATVFHFGETEPGEYFYAMELIAGETLEERVRRSGPLDVQSVIEIARQVAAALAAAEEQCLVHRDLKPSNILISARQENGHPAVKVIDFGVAKALAETSGTKDLTHNGFIGTPAFASPEQLATAPVDIRSDIYSLGATLWFLLTGHKPFGERVAPGTGVDPGLRIPPAEQLKAARVPASFIRLLVSMLASEPAARPAVSQLARQLEAIQKRLADPTTWWGPWVAAALVALLAIGVLAGFYWARMKSATMRPSIPEKSIAVLPFSNRSIDPSNAYLAEGMKDEILTRLSKVAALKVISRTSTLKFPSAPENVREVAQQLGVRNILEGSVQKSGGKVRITVQLINAQSDSHLWAETFDRQGTDIFQVESEVAQRVVSVLAATLTGSETVAIQAEPTSSVEAYEAYLKGRYFWNKRTVDGYKTAIDQFERAIKIDPTYALAYVGLADALLLLGGENVAEHDKALREGQAALQKALALDETLPQAHASLGLLAMNFTWNWAEGGAFNSNGPWN